MPDPSRRIRVLHLLTALGHGGAEIWLLNLIEPLRALGIDVEFGLKAASLGALRGVAEQRGAATHDIPLRWSHHGYVRAVRALCESRRYDVVHTHEFVYSAVGVLAAKLARRPVVSTFHHYTFAPQTAQTGRPGVRHLREAYGRASVAATLRTATLISTLSTAVIRRLAPRYEHDPRYRRLHLSIDVPPLASADDRAAMRRAFGWPASAPVVIHVGRFIEQKNHAAVLSIFRRLHERLPEARLLLCGQGPLLEPVLATASALPCAPAIHYAGLRDDVPSLLARSDALLFPSLSEGFGLVALEATAAGCPVVGSRIEGLDEAVREGEGAILHPVDDPGAFADSLHRLLRTPGEAQRFGLLGRRRAQEEYSHEASARELAAVYRECVR